MIKREDAQPMCCPYDGTELNLHASIVRDPVGREEVNEVDPDLGGVPLDVHACPTCGRGQSDSPVDGF